MFKISNEILKVLQKGNQTARAIKDLIREHKNFRKIYIELDGRYKADSNFVPIFSRKFTKNPNKVNNKINNDFFGEIVDTKVGYMFGNPILYKLPDIDEENEAYKYFQDFLKKNFIHNLDKETARLQAITGTAGRLLYIGEDEKEHIKLLNPWEFIIIDDLTGLAVQYGLRYYQIEVEENSRWFKRYRAEWYDSKNITFYIENAIGDFILDSTEGEHTKPHMFDMVPIIEYPNNEYKLSDPAKVIQAIDGYDRTVSDINSEIEQFANAYQKWTGSSKPTKELIEEMRKTGAVYCGKDGDVQWLVKNIDDAVTEHHLDRLDENIMRFSKTPKYTDENFAGNNTGVALDHKMLPLEIKAIDTEAKFKESNIKMFKVLQTAWKKKGIDIDPFTIEQVFTRKYPKNLVAEAEFLEKVKGNVPTEIAYANVSFIEDPKKAVRMMEEEMDPAAVTLNEEH